jgi:penicillin amidase
MKRWIKRIALGVPALLMVISAGGWLWLRSSLPVTKGDLVIAGLEQPVEIRRDDRGVPHISAKTDHDAYFALGYVHAQDRLWQMDFHRRLGAGRLSEVIGPPTLGMDRYMRTLGLHRLAAESVRRMKPDMRRAVEAYTSGVNAYLESRNGAWPLEFYLLRYRPEPWKAADSLVWGRLMGIHLSRNWQEEVLRSRIIKSLGAAAVDTLLPNYPTDGPRTLASVAGFAPNLLTAGSASNGWAITGPRTRDGTALLANDPHLRFRTPALWYLVKITAPALSLEGATVPGVPFLVLGRNQRIAWGVTSAEIDVQDLYVEQVERSDQSWYRTPEGARPFTVREERIRVRGGEDVLLTVRETRHGPVISDVVPSLDTLVPSGHVIALSTPALDKDDRTSEALYLINAAQNWRQFREALKYWHAPPVNFVYADTAGKVGILSPARIPVRYSGDGELPAEGWSGEYDWTGMVPFDDLPQSVDPATGYVANANNPTAPASYRFTLGRLRTPGYRARRLDELIADTEKHDMASMTKMQNDMVSVASGDMLKLLLHTSPRSEDAGRIHALLRAWDGTMARHIPQPLIFIAWLRALDRRLFADELGPVYADYRGLNTQSMKIVLERDKAWCDDTATDGRETCDDQVALALDDALTELSMRFGNDFLRWQWGNAHEVRFDHPVLGRLPGIGKWFNIRLPSDGGPFTLNRGMVRTGNDRAPYASVHGAAYRAVYDLANPGKSRYMVSPGQSGNWFSRHYDDLANTWRNGGFISLQTPGKNAHLLTLRPRPAR